MPASEKCERSICGQSLPYPVTLRSNHSCKAWSEDFCISCGPHDGILCLVHTYLTYHSRMLTISLIGFGATNTTSPFGAAKPAFGAPASTPSGGLFGGSNTSTTASTGFGGGFGGNTASTTPAFGSNNNNNNNNNTGGGLFGSQNKPAFGSAPSGGSLFGGGASTSGFGAGAATGGFGGASTGFGASQPVNNGTAATPFTPYTEKDAASNTNSHYQTISFQQPYQNFSLEELRLADYNAGRRFGNTNGQAGAFGQSTGFGGFGANQSSGTTTGGFGSTAAAGNTGGLFGASANTSSPFGQTQTQQPASTGFGSGGGLFGSQNKSATGGLFGSQPASSAQPSGGLFGTSGSTGFGSGGGGFGSNATANTTGGGLFGNNSQTQNKPAFGGFGGSAGAGTGTGFGASTGGFGTTATTSAGGGLFGNSTATTNNNPFGGAQQPSTGGGLFGGSGGFGANNQNQTQTQTQNQTGGGLFGGFGQNNQQNQQKPGGLFGGSTTGASTGGGLFGQNNQQQQQQQPQTGGGLFGNNNANQQQSGGLFGGANNQQQSGGLFGAKPATSTPSLFGNTQSNPGNTGGGLFGGLNNSQNQQNQSGGLFGNNNQQQQQKPSLFGGSLGGATNNTAGGSSLFGNNNNNQQQGSSLFGTPQQGQQQAQGTPLTASLLGGNPYGNDQLFANLASPSPPVGPIATPLSGAQKPAKRPPMLPSFKINPSNSLRLITPQKRANGYGFSYSTYGTPGSAQSFSGLGNSLLGSGSNRLTQSLGKSFSTSNLRTAFSAEDSVLAPGAFTPNYSRPYSSGSIRKLKIDRSLRTDLFGADGTSEGPAAKKRVSFDAAGASKSIVPAVNGDASPGPNNALVRTETDDVGTNRAEPSSEELGYMRAPRPNTNGVRTNGTSARPEMEQVRGNELAVVPEDEPAAQVSPSKAAPTKDVGKQPQDGLQYEEYWMSPSLSELRQLSRDQLKHVQGFTAGRVGYGKIEFDEVDLTTVPLDRILGDIVQFEERNATVYKEAGSPPMGKGLNVPSTITLENCWPRAKAGRVSVPERSGMRFDKHIERLKRITNTEFISYDSSSGEWKFRVQHFTTYGLDDDEDEDVTQLESSMLSPPPENLTPTPKAQTPAVRSSEMTQTSQEDTSMLSPESSNPDDTFDFKRGPRKSLPGGFGDQPVYDDEDMRDETDVMDADGEYSADDLDHAQTGALDDPFGPAPHPTNGVVHAEEEHTEDVTGSFSAPTATNNDFGLTFGGSMLPRSILKATTAFGTPGKQDLDFDGDWAEQLQRTVSPKKQDRQLLRDRQAVVQDEDEPKLKNAPFKASLAVQTFSTTMDIMNSLWGQSPKATGQGTTVTAGGKGFEV